MLKQPLFWKLSLSHALIFGVTALAFSFFGSEHVTLILTAGLSTTVLLAFFQTSRIVRPLNELLQVCRAMREGQYWARVGRRSKDEIGLLGSMINKLGQETAKKLDILSQEEAQLRAMLGNMVEGVIAIDNEDNILFCNRAAKTMLEDPLLDKPGKKLWESPQFYPIQEVVERARKQKRAVVSEVRYHASTERLTIDVAATWLDLGEMKGVIIVLHNVSTLKRLEQMRTDFVANVSHELKTPLTSIKGYVETLLDGALEDKDHNRKFLEKIESNVKQLSNLVQDLLDLARLESEDALLPKQPVDWDSLLDEILIHQEAFLATKKIDLQYVPIQLPLTVLGDRKAMFQVAENLIDNAVKYTPAGRQIRIEVLREDPWGILRISDDGIGIPTKDLPRIFERFYRVDKARSRELGGTGLGLSIVKHLVQAMGGQVRVRSEEGRGSTFEVLLPLQH